MGLGLGFTRRLNHDCSLTHTHTLVQYQYVRVRVRVSGFVYCLRRPDINPVGIQQIVISLQILVVNKVINAAMELPIGNCGAIGFCRYACT